MITAEGLRKRYGGLLVLDEVGCQVPAGSCLALLGPNGAGKTTLLRILATLLRPTRGTLHVAGVDALRNPAAARERIGVLGHGSYVYEDLTALENLRFWATMHGRRPSDERLRVALQQVELDAVADERTRTFSAGMKRRLALARVTLTEPKVLLLDEPFTALDRRGRKWLGEHLLAFKAAGGSVVLATHSLASGLEVADRVIILAAGRPVLDRPTAEMPGDEVRRLYDSLTDGTGEAS